jgi:hypothetical protein
MGNKIYWNDHTTVLAYDGFRSKFVLTEYPVQIYLSELLQIGLTRLDIPKEGIPVLLAQDRVLVTEGVESHLPLRHAYILRSWCCAGSVEITYFLMVVSPACFIKQPPTPVTLDGIRMRYPILFRRHYLSTFNILSLYLFSSIQQSQQLIRRIHDHNP